MTDLSLEHLSVRVGTHHIVHELDLRIGTGEIVGLVGPNGSGKSTALRCVYRALRPTGGVVRVGGDDLSRQPERETARRVAALTQDGGADLDFTVRELVELGRAPYRRGNQRLTESERARCEMVMRTTDVLHLADRGVRGLSGGERQRVLLARALTQEPEVLVLDEPTNHLDLRHQIAVLSHLRTTDLTIVVVLHDLNLAAAMCDRIGMLAGGRLVAVGTPAEVLTRERIADVYGIDVLVTEHPLTGDPQLLFTLDPRTAETGAGDQTSVSAMEGHHP